MYLLAALLREAMTPRVGALALLPPPSIALAYYIYRWSVHVSKVREGGGRVGRREGGERHRREDVSDES